MKNMLKDTAILLIITLISGAVLGFVYELTKNPIALQEEKAKQEAYKEVFADAASFEAMTDLDETAMTAVAAEGGYTETSVNEVAKAVDGSGSVLGYVITVTSHAGYGGDIKFSMGVRSDGTLNGISILSISETAGLGMRAEEVLKPQFSGKQVVQFSVTKSGAASGDQIDAISGATITSNAVTNAVNAGLYYYQNELEGGVQ